MSVPWFKIDDMCYYKGLEQSKDYGVGIYSPLRLLNSLWSIKIRGMRSCNARKLAELQLSSIPDCHRIRGWHEYRGSLNSLLIRSYDIQWIPRVGISGQV